MSLVQKNHQDEDRGVVGLRATTCSIFLADTRRLAGNLEPGRVFLSGTCRGAAGAAAAAASGPAPQTRAPRGPPPPARAPPVSPTNHLVLQRQPRQQVCVPPLAFTGGIRARALAHRDRPESNPARLRAEMDMDDSWEHHVAPLFIGCTQDAEEDQHGDFLHPDQVGALSSLKIALFSHSSLLEKNSRVMKR